MKRAVALISLSMLPFLLLGTELVGHIQNAKTGESVSGAEVSIAALSLKVYSHEDGRFMFRKILDGHYLLKITRQGYAEQEIQIGVDAGKSKTLIIEIHPLHYSEEMTVTATRAIERYTPVVFTDVSQKAIKEEHTVEDVPMLLMGLPNVYSYSDDGSGIGYSYLKIRGFDQTRIGVMINGIPLNDPEDHQVYWVNMPDFAESLSSIQIQRGVGTSLYGVDTFGGSVNLQTTGETDEEQYQVTSNAGSFGAQKLGIMGAVPMKNGYHLSFRGSYLTSDGYRENSGVEQWSAYLSLAHYGERSVTRFITYTGNELTHAAWEASPQSVLEENHRHNPITYQNTVDDFTQPHYELHHTFLISDSVHLKNTLFAIHGKGYYEQYKYGRDMYDYGLWRDEASAPESDIIRQKWVRKTQYGLITEVGVDHENGQTTIGAYLSTYSSHHWGEVDDLLDLDIPSYEPGFIYHLYFSDKDYVTLYINELYQINEHWTLMANLHYQNISYSLDQEQVGNFEGENLHSLTVDYHFLNPRLGLNVNVSDQLSMFVNVSVAHREPTDSQLFDTWQGPDDLGVAPLFNHFEEILDQGELVRRLWTDPQVEEEELVDYEFGMTYVTSRMNFKANLFYMDFRNEIVPYGQVDDDGFPIRGNAEKTVHRGIELAGKFQLTPKFELDANLSFNDNYYKEFTYKEYDWSTGGVQEVDFSGHTIPGFPESIANTTLTYRTTGFMVAVHWQVFGKQYLDNANLDTRSISSFEMLNAWLNYQLPWTGILDRIELSFNAKNLLDKKTYTSGYYDAWAGENYLWPGATRNLTMGVRLKY